MAPIDPFLGRLLGVPAADAERVLTAREHARLAVYTVLDLADIAAARVADARADLEIARANAGLAAEQRIDTANAALAEAAAAIGDLAELVHRTFDNAGSVAARRRAA